MHCGCADNHQEFSSDELQLNSRVEIDRMVAYDRKPLTGENVPH